MDALDAQLAALQAALKDDGQTMSGNKPQVMIGRVTLTQGDDLWR